MEVIATNKKKIGIQGYPGSFHQEAAEKYYGRDIEVVPAATFPELISKASDSNACDEAIIAIENSIAGSILPNYKLLEESILQITGEVYLKINHQLLALPGTQLEDITEVHSHPMAILQTVDFFANFPKIRLIESIDTAYSAKQVAANGQKHVGAIASKSAAERCGLDIIAGNIESVANNYTRFLILSRNETDSEQVDKASILFELSNTPGSLSQVLHSIHKSGINISKIQSVPVVLKEWKYTFHLDLEFDSQGQFELLINRLHATVEKLQVLGKYKRGIK